MTDENKVAETVSADEKVDCSGAVGVAGAGAPGVADDSRAAGAAAASGAGGKSAKGAGWLRSSCE